LIRSNGNEFHFRSRDQNASITDGSKVFHL
jgi:hypothetical protein